MKNTPKNNLIPILLIGSGVLLMVVLLIWKLLPAGSNQLVAGTSATSSIPYANIKRISLVDAKAALGAKTAIFVDVRDLDVYKSSHISGAVSIPLGDVAARANELKPDQWIITYCT